MTMDGIRDDTESRRSLQLSHFLDGLRAVITAVARGA